jgi:hypothetical protein
MRIAVRALVIGVCLNGCLNGIALAAASWTPSGGSQQSPAPSGVYQGAKVELIASDDLSYWKISSGTPEGTLTIP